MRRNILALVLLICFLSLLVYAIRSNIPTSSRSFAETSLIVPFSAQSLSSTPAPEIEIDRLNLQNDLSSEINERGLDDNVSLYYKNLAKGYEVTINPDRSWIPASMVKAYIVVEAFRQKEARLINFDSRVTIREENIVPTELELPNYQPLRAGVKATMRELVDAMIDQSDNTAFNTLIDVLDRRNITATLRNLGLTDTVVGEKLSLDDNQEAIDLAVPGRQPNKTTARDFGKLFNLMYEGKVPDSAEMLNIFKKQKINDMIPALLPAEIEIAHKTGRWSPYNHDGGIVYKPNEPFTLAVFSNNDDPKVVAQLAKISYYKSRDVLGASTESIRGWLNDLFQGVKNFLGR